MNRMTKIFIIAIAYGFVAFGAVKWFEMNAIFDYRIWFEAFAWAGIAFAFGFVENALGLSFFKGWINKEE